MADEKNQQTEREWLTSLQNDFSLSEALEAPFMSAKLTYEKIVSQITGFREKRASVKLTLAEKKELRRLRRVKIARDFRSRSKLK